MKQSVSRQRVEVGGHFWQPRYYDFNVWSEKKRIEKLRYIHRNPVRRGLVKNPEDWQWSSYRHYRGPQHARCWRVGVEGMAANLHHLDSQVQVESRRWRPGPNYSPCKQ